MSEPVERTSRRLGSTLLLASFLVGLALSGCSDPEPRTRIVLVTLDTLRLEALTGPGASELMPRTLELLEGGTEFTSNFASSGTTLPTHASLLTGLHPWEHGLTRNGQVLDEEHETLPEHLAGLGFETHAVIASFPLDGRFGLNQGFDTYHVDFDEQYVKSFHGEEVEAGRFYTLSDTITSRALAALDSARGPQQFFWFHYFDAHGPYGDTTGADLRCQSIRDLAAQRDPALADTIEEARRLYGEDVRHMDRSLARLLERILAESSEYVTHLVITSDHGESFGELGALGHGRRLTREQVQVPLWILSPGLAGGARGDVSSSIDLPRTVLGMAGLPGGSFPGRDLAAPGAPEERGVALGMRRTFQGVTDEVLTDGTTRTLPRHWFFAVHEGELLAGNRRRILTEDDPARRRELAELPELHALFERLHDTAAALKAGRAIEDEAVLESLRSLGYAR